MSDFFLKINEYFTKVVASQKLENSSEIKVTTDPTSIIQKNPKTPFSLKTQTVDLKNNPTNLDQHPSEVLSNQGNVFQISQELDNETSSSFDAPLAGFSENNLSHENHPIRLKALLGSVINALVDVSDQENQNNNSPKSVNLNNQPVIPSIANDAFLNTSINIDKTTQANLLQNTAMLTLNDPLLTSPNQNLFETLTFRTLPNKPEIPFSPVESIVESIREAFTISEKAPEAPVEKQPTSSINLKFNTQNSTATSSEHYFISPEKTVQTFVVSDQSSNFPQLHPATQTSQIPVAVISTLTPATSSEHHFISPEKTVQTFVVNDQSSNSAQLHPATQINQTPVAVISTHTPASSSEDHFITPQQTAQTFVVNDQSSNSPQRYPATQTSQTPVAVVNSLITTSSNEDRLVTSGTQSTFSIPNQLSPSNITVQLKSDDNSLVPSSAKLTNINEYSEPNIKEISWKKVAENICDQILNIPDAHTSQIILTGSLIEGTCITRYVENNQPILKINTLSPVLESALLEPKAKKALLKNIETKFNVDIASQKRYFDLDTTTQPETPWTQVANTIAQQLTDIPVADKPILKVISSPPWAAGWILSIEKGQTSEGNPTKILKTFQAPKHIMSILSQQPAAKMFFAQTFEEKGFTLQDPEKFFKLSQEIQVAQNNDELVIEKLPKSFSEFIRKPNNQEKFSSLLKKFGVEISPIICDNLQTQFHIQNFQPTIAPINPPSKIQEKWNLVAQQISEVSIKATKDQTETTLTLKFPPELQGVQVVIQKHMQAPGQLNLQFANLSENARKLFDSSTNQMRLRNSLEEKGLRIHVMQTQTDPISGIAENDFLAYQDGTGSNNPHHQQDPRKQRLFAETQEELT